MPDLAQGMGTNPKPTGSAGIRQKTLHPRSEPIAVLVSRNAYYPRILSACPTPTNMQLAAHWDDFDRLAPRSVCAIVAHERLDQWVTRVRRLRFRYPSFRWCSSRHPTPPTPGTSPRSTWMRSSGYRKSRKPSGPP